MTIKQIEAQPNHLFQRKLSSLPGRLFGFFPNGSEKKKHLGESVILECPFDLLDRHDDQYQNTTTLTPVPNTPAAQPNKRRRHKSHHRRKHLKRSPTSTSSDSSCTESDSNSESYYTPIQPEPLQCFMLSRLAHCAVVIRSMYSCLRE